MYNEYDEKYITGCIRGFLAEKIFELIHLELRCQIYRTGVEHLYPHLYELSKGKKKTTQRHKSDVDVELLKYVYERLAVRREKEGNLTDAKKYRNKSYKDLEDEIAKIRFGVNDKELFNIDHSHNLYKSPDFTIVTSAGIVYQFEIKYRYNGELSEEDKNKYLASDMPPLIFLIMNQEPYIKILAAGGDKFNLSNDARFLAEEKNSNRSSRSIKYIVLERDKNGNLEIQRQLKSEILVYPKEILDKYSRIIKKWFEYRK